MTQFELDLQFCKNIEMVIKAYAKKEFDNKGWYRSLSSSGSRWNRVGIVNLENESDGGGQTIISFSHYTSFKRNLIGKWSYQIGGREPNVKISNEDIVMEYYTEFTEEEYFQKSLLYSDRENRGLLLVSYITDLLDREYNNIFSIEIQYEGIDGLIKYVKNLGKYNDTDYPDNAV